MESQTFYWHVYFLSAPMLADAVHLDAVLWAALVRCGIEPKKAISDIPLEKGSDFFCRQRRTLRRRIAIAAGGPPCPIRAISPYG